MTGEIRRRVIVSGAVQGVGFRWSAQAMAERDGLTGFAGNRADDTVEVEAEGRPDAVDTFIDWLRHGPPSASVSGIEVSEIEPTGTTGFEVG